LTPDLLTCAAVRFFYSLGYTVCYASLLIKTNRIARIFGAKKRSNSNASAGSSNINNVQPLKRPKYTSPLSAVFIVGLLVLFQCVLNFVWLILRPPKVDEFIKPDYDNKFIIAYRFCEALEDEDMIIGLIFPVCLLALTALYAFKTRKLPGYFNESRYIAITTYSTLVIWIAFIPFFFTAEDIRVRIFSLCASLILNGAVTLSVLFAPKLYVVLLKPHKNTKERVMGRPSNKPRLPGEESIVSLSCEDVLNHRQQRSCGEYDMESASM